MTRPFGIAGIQMSVVPWEPKATAAKMEGAVRYLARAFPWIDLILGHELALSGLVQFSGPADAPVPRTLAELAEPVPGPMTDRFCQLAAGVGKWLVPGSLYEIDGGEIFNTAVVISPQGEIVAKYRKMFPWLPYEAGVSPGTDFCVFDIDGVGRFGMAICYDMWFPEVARTLAWMGAEVILHPSMTATSDRDAELSLARANAIFNQCYVVGVNGVGSWGGGQSLIVDPDGRVVQQAGERQMLLTEVMDLDHVSRAREYGTFGLSPLWKQFRDHRGGFPVYAEGAERGPVFDSLGRLAPQRTLRPTTPAG